MATPQSTAMDLAWTRKLAHPQELDQFRQEISARVVADAPRIMVCCGTGCKAVGSLDVLKALQTEVSAAGLGVQVIPEVKRTGCHGFCSRGPLITILPQNLFYQRVKPEDAGEIIQKTLVGGEVLKRFLFKPQGAKEPLAKVSDIPFFTKQTKVVLKRVGKIDPFDIKDALVNGAYSGLVKVLTQMTPAQVIE
jgi:NADH-quinone oxidoreductase subunit F